MTDQLSVLCEILESSNISVDVLVHFITLDMD